MAEVQGGQTQPPPHSPPPRPWQSAYLSRGCSPSLLRTDADFHCKTRKNPKQSRTGCSKVACCCRHLPPQYLDTCLSAGGHVSHSCPLDLGLHHSHCEPFLSCPLAASLTSQAPDTTAAGCAAFQGAQREGTCSPKPPLTCFQIPLKHKGCRMLGT